MAAQPVPDRALEALHDRIGRDTAELRRRWVRTAGRPRWSPGGALRVLVEVSRVLQAAQGLAVVFRRELPDSSNIASTDAIDRSGPGGGQSAGRL